jgi:uncharacterized Rmd1/YagE family protein
MEKSKREKLMQLYSFCDLGHWNLANLLEFIKNAHSLANLERLKIRDFSSATAIKNYVKGVEIIIS